MGPRKSVDIPAKTKTAKAKAKNAAAIKSWSPPPSSTVIAEHMVRVHEALKVIREHPIFDGIDTASPLTINQGGEAVCGR